MLSFYISRYASNEEQAGLVFRAVKSIRLIYPTAPITVVDDGSDARFPLDNLTENDPNVRQMTNAFKGSGEVGTLRAFLTHGAADEVAVVMHDSMVMRRPLPADQGLGAKEGVRFLWHFDRYELMHLHASLAVISTMREFNVSNSARLLVMLMYGMNKNWTGCFGMAMVVRHSRLAKLQERTGFFGSDVMEKLTNREMRQACERVLSILLHVVNEGSPPITSLCGSVFDHPEAWGTRLSAAPLGALLAVPYDSVFMKTWMGR